MLHTLALVLMLGLHDAEATASDWYVVNDSVMGGVSTSEVVDDNGAVLFRGQLSLENNGGFTSTRTEAVPDDWSGVAGVKMTIMGDGRSYIATIRTRTPRMRRIYYRQAFKTVAGETMEITLPLSDFQAYAYGQRVPTAPPITLVLDQIGSIGVMLADKNPGAFSLRIDSVTTYTGDTQSDTADAASRPATRVTDLLQLAISDGVPLFNSGQPGRCADVYRTALVSVMLLAPDQLTATQLETLGMTVRLAQRTESEEERAWALRRAIDWLMSELVALD